MKLTIERAALLKALAHVQSVVERRNTIPILSNVLLDAANGGLRLNATDMDIAIEEQVGAEVEQPAATTTPAHTLYDIVRKLPDGAQVSMEAAGDGGQIVLRAGRAQFTLACLPKDDFPVMSAGDLPHQFSLPAAELRNLVDRTRFAISTEETRYYLNGIYLHATEVEGTKTLRAVATDGHRLARVEMPLPDGADGMPGVIVPRKAVAELRKLVEDTTDPVGISLSDTRIRFAFDDVVLTSKLIDGTFPDYERVIPAGNDKVMDVDAASFAQAVDRVSTISTDKSRAVKLSLGNNTLVLTANSPESGTATEEIEVSYQGDAIEIGFNSRYLLDITQQIEGDGAKFIMADGASPTIVQDGSDATALYVLMPMRV
ncbi:MAG: DNA polymerase III subunit beta [Rhodospirillaceae bacterium]|jgi:DNA polymerase III subunit beta|nr:DNA polymerase III subunit beta [Rhodospirillaceae bacterium]MBT5415692.1 DNA polymerase III subunit beta [Rhodospirillaceae bacterium]MBT6116283.1 DNA polymerase III subunit beta [Rhodospirillaceae bacterium]